MCFRNKRSTRCCFSRRAAQQSPTSQGASPGADHPLAFTQRRSMHNSRWCTQRPMLSHSLPHKNSSGSLVVLFLKQISTSNSQLFICGVRDKKLPKRRGRGRAVFTHGARCGWRGEWAL